MPLTENFDTLSGWTTYGLDDYEDVYADGQLHLININEDGFSANFEIAKSISVDFAPAYSVIFESSMPDNWDGSPISLEVYLGCDGPVELWDFRQSAPGAFFQLLRIAVGLIESSGEEVDLSISEFGGDGFINTPFSIDVPIADHHFRLDFNYDQGGSVHTSTNGTSWTERGSFSFNYDWERTFTVLGVEVNMDINSAPSHEVTMDYIKVISTPGGSRPTHTPNVTGTTGQQSSLFAPPRSR
jgi:hypothetical protein